jgi:O-succinylbenzoic acid--CoA ligase
MAHHLREAGIVEGERVSLLMHAGWRYIAAIMAVIRVKAIACPMSNRLPQKALLARMQQINSSTMISDVEAPPPKGIRVLDPDNLFEFVSGLAHPKPRHDLEQPALIIFTSGSSGKPKAALLSYGALYYSCRGANINLQLSSNNKWLLSIPLYHVGGIGVVFRCLESGATVVVAKPGEKLAEEIELYQATHLSVVPTQLYRLISMPDAKEVSASLHTVLLGGAAISAERVKQAMDVGYPVHATYGLTEMASQVTTLPKYFPDDKLGTSGVLLRYRELKLSGDGEIHVRGQTLFSGYVEGDALVKPFDAEGWFATGDLGRVDAEGYLSVIGRKDTMFVSGGENIHPEEIEQAVLELGDIDAVVVVPKDDAEFGQRPVAYVASRLNIEPEHVANRLEEFLPRFKIPVAFYDWPADAPEGVKVDRAWFAKHARTW